MRLLLCTLALCLAATASAQNWGYVAPDYTGGYYSYDYSTGVRGYLSPDYAGGYYYRNSAGTTGWIAPDYAGGYYYRLYNWRQPRRSAWNW